MTPSSSRAPAVSLRASAASGAFSRVAPEDRGAALRGDDRVDRVGEHQVDVADADAEGAAAAAFAGDDRDDRGFEHRHLGQVAGDRLGLAAGLGLDAGVGAGRVDQADHREVALLGQLHEAQGLAVSLRAGHAEVALDVFLDGAALLVADEHDAVVVRAWRSRR